MTPIPHRGTDLDGHFLRFLWHRAEAQGEETVFVLSEGPDAYRVWRDLDLSPEVYRHSRIKEVSYTRGTDVAELVPPGTPPERLLVLTGGDVPPDLTGATVGRQVYRAEPGYAPLMRALGLENTPFDARFRTLSSWADPTEWQRRVWEAHLQP